MRRDDRYRSRNSGTTWAAVILVGLGLVGLLYMMHLPRESLENNQAMRQMYQTVRNDLSAVLDASHDANGHMVPVHAQFSTPVERGAAGVIHEFMNYAIGRSLALRNSYLADLRAAGWPRVLDRQRIANDPDMAEGMKIVARTRPIVISYRQKIDHLRDEVRNKISMLNMSASDRELMMRGFDEKAATDSSYIDDQLGLESTLVDQVEQLLVLLRDSSGRWKLSGDKFLFRDDVTLEQFQTRMASIHQIVEASKQMRARRETALKQSLDASGQ